MNRAEYKVYLASAEWRDKRKQVWDRAKGTCEECGGRGRDVHHQTYARIGDERLEDLILLCRECHEAKHPKKVPTFEQLEEMIRNL